MVSFIFMVWLYEYLKYVLVDLVFYLFFYIRVEFLRIVVYCLMINIFVKNIC